MDLTKLSICIAFSSFHVMAPWSGWFVGSFAQFDKAGTLTTEKLLQRSAQMAAIYRNDGTSHIA